MKYDRELGAMVRDPRNADKTAAEILVKHRKGREERLLDDEYEEARLAIGVLIIITTLGGIVLWQLWPRLLQVFS